MLRLAYLPPKKKAKEKPYGPIGKDGELQMPLKRTQEEEDRDRYLAEKKIRDKEKKMNEG